MLLQVILINRNRKKLSGAGVTLIENAVMGLNWVRQIKYIMGNIGLRSWVQIFTPPSLFNKFYISSCYCCYKSLSISCLCILSILPQRNTLVSITLTTPRHSRPTLAPHTVTWILMIRHLGVCMTDILEWTARCMWLWTFAFCVSTVTLSHIHLNSFTPEDLPTDAALSPLASRYYILATILTVKPRKAEI